MGCHFARLLFHLGTAPSSLPYLCYGHLSRNTAAILTSLRVFLWGGGFERGQGWARWGSSCLIISLSLGLLDGIPHLWSPMGRPPAEISFALPVLSQPGLGCPQTQHPCRFHLPTLSQGRWERESFFFYPSQTTWGSKLTRMCGFRSRKAGASTSLTLGTLVLACVCLTLAFTV